MNTLAPSAVTADKLALDVFALEVLADVTLASNGATLSSGTFTARNYLRFYLTMSGVGTTDLYFRFNGDTAANYAATYAAPASTTLTTEINRTALIISGVSTLPNVYVFGDVMNTAGKEKLAIWQKTAAGAGAASAPGLLVSTGKWANTTNQITQIDIVALTGGGSIAAGSRLVVVGHD